MTTTDQFGQVVHLCPTCHKPFLTTLPNQKVPTRDINNALAFHSTTHKPSF